MASVAMMLGPPARVSPPIGWPRISCNGACSMRARMSLVPPVGLGRMMRIDLLGQDWAWAGMSKIASALAKAIARATVFRCIVFVLFYDLLFACRSALRSRGRSSNYAEKEAGVQPRLMAQHARSARWNAVIRFDNREPTRTIDRKSVV